MVGGILAWMRSGIQTPVCYLYLGGDLSLGESGEYSWQVCNIYVCTYIWLRTPF